MTGFKLNYEWWNLRSIGNLKVLKVSYFALAFIPILAENRFLSWIGGDKIVLFCSFFGSLLLALANLLYDIVCPEIVKRFASPNDLYEKMLEIKKLSDELYPEDNFNASYEHCKNKYYSDSQSKQEMRFFCALMFWLSGIFFAVVILNRTSRVVLAIFI